MADAATGNRAAPAAGTAATVGPAMADLAVPVAGTAAVATMMARTGHGRAQVLAPRLHHRQPAMRAVPAAATVGRAGLADGTAAMPIQAIRRRLETPAARTGTRATVVRGVPAAGTAAMPILTLRAVRGLPLAPVAMPSRAILDALTVGRAESDSAPIGRHLQQARRPPRGQRQRCATRRRHGPNAPPPLRAGTARAALARTRKKTDRRVLRSAPPACHPGLSKPPSRQRPGRRFPGPR